MNRIVLFGGVAVIAAAIAVAVGATWFSGDRPGGAGPSAAPASVDIARGAEIYAQSCAACHGASLEGQPDWQSPDADGMLPAPPHDASGHTWHHPDRVLFAYTKLGGAEALSKEGIEFNSGMPGFGDQLSDQEIWNVIAYIQSTWPEREKQVQAARTQADIEQGGG